MTNNMRTTIAVLGVAALSAFGLTPSAKADQTCRVVRFGTAAGANTGSENYSKITFRCASGAILWYKVLNSAGRDTAAVAASQAEASRLTDLLSKAWDTGAEIFFVENGGQVSYWELQFKP